MFLRINEGLILIFPIASIVVSKPSAIAMFRLLGQGAYVVKLCEKCVI